MDSLIAEMQLKIDVLTKLNAELNKYKHEYMSQKQSLNRMSVRLRKLCKRLTPSTEIVVEMQQIAAEIKESVKDVTSQSI